MSHFAKINLNTKLVERVIVAEQDFVDNLPGVWIQTSYNTHGNVHSLGGIPLRKNYASIGYTYDFNRDAFYTPEPSGSIGFDDSTCTWIMPTPPPTGSI